MRCPAWWGGFSFLLVLLSSPAAADIVHLKTGRKIEGTTAPGPKEGTVEVRTGDGSVVVIPEAEIARIEKKQSPGDELDERLRRAPPGELEPLEDLLVLAREKRLPQRAKVIARKILDIDPNHEIARRELGFVVYENQWILEAELKKKKGLVRFRDEWMTQAEKDRRLIEEARQEVEGHFDLLESDNPHIQEFSLRKILARREPALREVFCRRLRDERETVRMVAVRALAGFPARGAGDEEAKRIAADLHRLALEEPSENVLKVAHLTLRKFHPAESFRLALETATASPRAEHRQRAGLVLYETLKKAYVPDLCRAVAGGNGAAPRTEVREVLKRALKVDHGYDAAAWLAYWSENQARFTDD
jgi:hypothetical protein